MKPALGRNLGTLLGKPAAGETTEPSAPAAPQPGPGVRSLLRGQRSESAPAEITAPPAARELIPVWYFFAADLVLVLMALALIFRTPSAVSWAQRFCAMGLVSLGGVASILGVLRCDKEGEAVAGSKLD